ncbi:MAG: TMEM165/GDT1 family protein [Cyanobacteria bacterium J06642_2]
MPKRFYTVLQFIRRSATVIAASGWIVGHSAPVLAREVATAVETSASQNLADGATALAVSPWQWIALTFTTVFVAEMGDKTQLATMLMSAREKSPWSIFLGSASALVAASAVSVLLGNWVARAIPAEFLQLLAGASFTTIGLYVLWQELTGRGAAKEITAPPPDEAIDSSMAAEVRSDATEA